MRVSFVVIAALILGIQQTVAYTIVVKAGVKECFYEDLHKDDRMTITFQVGEGGHLDIDFTVSELDFCHIISAIFGNIELNDIYGSKAFTLYRERLNSKCTYIMLITNAHVPCKYPT